MKTVTLKIVEYDWHILQLADKDLPFVGPGTKVYAIQNQADGRYFYWAYRTKYIEKVLKKLSETFDQSTFRYFNKRPIKVSGRIK